MPEAEVHAAEGESLKRVASVFTEQELQQIDEWGFARRIRDRSKAISGLVREGLIASSGNATRNATAASA